MNTLQKYEKYLYAIIFLGAIIYFPIFFNGFVWDDIDYILTNPQVHQLNLPVLFGQSLFNSGPFYRPIPAVYFAIVYSLFGQHAFMYHLLQLILHLADTSLLFLFLCIFFSDGIGFFLALLFLVHPINVESVAYIGSTQSELYFLPGIIALLLSQTKDITRKRLFWITGLLLFSALTKETGFLFILLAIASRYLFKLGKVKEFLLSGASIVTVYGVLRVLLGGVTFSGSNIVPIATLSLPQRLLNIPSIVFYYLKTFVFPLQLTIEQSWIVNSMSFQDFILPFIVCLVFMIAVIYFALALSKRPRDQQHVKQKYQKEYLLEKEITIQEFLFFALWFVIGMGIILQIVPLDMTVADRWFYFPIVGLLGMIGVALQVLLPSIRQHFKSYLYTVLIIVCLLSVRTFIRTFDWKNELTIYADAQHASSNNYMLDNAYAIELFNSGQHDKAITYDKQSIAIYPSIINIRLLADFYKNLHQDNDAIRTYNQAINYYKPDVRDNLKGFVQREDDDLENVYNSLAYEYLATNDSNDAISLITTKALMKFPNDPDLYVSLAIAYSKLGNHDQAMNAISKARNLRPDQYTNTIYTQIENNTLLNNLNY